MLNFNSRLAIALALAGCSAAMMAMTVCAATASIYDSKGKRDPFLPLIGRNVRVTDVTLLNSIKDVKVEGVIIDPKRGSAAIINGQIVKVGEFIGGFKLEEVGQYIVKVSREGQQFNLQFRNKQDDQGF